MKAARLLLILFYGLAAAPAPVWAQHLGGGTTPELSFVRIGAALIFCLVASFGLVIAYRRYPDIVGQRRAFASLASGFARARRLEVIESRRVSAHADVCLIRCDRDEYLILCGPGGSTVLRTGASNAEGATVLASAEPLQ